MTTIIETENLLLRVPEKSDAAMILALFNQDDFIQFIGDKEVRTVSDAETFIEEKFLGHYREHGFCLFITEQKKSQLPVGICGLVKREGLDDVDIGFAILTEFQGKGVVTEAAIGARDYAINTLGLKRLAGITDVNNHGSGRVLEKIGLRYEKNIKLTADDEEIKFFILQC